MILFASLLLAAAPAPAGKADEACPPTRFTLNKPAAPKAKPETPKPKIVQAPSTTPKADPKLKPGECESDKKTSKG